MRSRLTRLLALLGLALLLSSMVGVGRSSARQGANIANAFFGVNISTGAFTPLGCIGLRERVVGMALTNSVGYALTERGQLARFPLNNPYSITGSVAISGLGLRDRLIGIDIRPLTGVLYGVGSSGTVYTIDPASGVATVVGSGAGPDGNRFGVDFNPQADRIRVVSDRAQNLRLNPDTGTLAAVDKTLAYAAGDVNQGKGPKVEGAAYTNNVANAASTQLFVLDIRTSSLALQSPPNDGALTTIGGTGYNLSSVGGFDITPGGAAYAVGHVNGVGC